jgi:hypothetical protein
VRDVVYVNGVAIETFCAPGARRRRRVAVLLGLVIVVEELEFRVFVAVFVC